MTGSGTSDKVASLSNPDYLQVGTFVRPHGIAGEIRMKIVTDFPERISKRENLFVGLEYVTHRLLGVRKHREGLLIRLEGIADRNAAESFRDKPVYVHISEAVPLEDGEYYQFQLIGLQVATEDGQVIGTLDDIIETGANDVYVINGPHGEILLPAIPQVIRHVDVAEGRILVHLLDGLLGE